MARFASLFNWVDSGKFLLPKPSQAGIPTPGDFNLRRTP
jgi:hypothetical protein